MGFDIRGVCVILVLGPYLLTVGVDIYNFHSQRFVAGNLVVI
jgi:hypothetical protein